MQIRNFISTQSGSRYCIVTTGPGDHAVTYFKRPSAGIVEKHLKVLLQVSAVLCYLLLEQLEKMVESYFTEQVKGFLCNQDCVLHDKVVYMCIMCRPTISCTRRNFHFKRLVFVAQVTEESYELRKHVAYLWKYEDK